MFVGKIRMLDGLVSTHRLFTTDSFQISGVATVVSYECKMLVKLTPGVRRPAGLQLSGKRKLELRCVYISAISRVILH
jgi:hypothetical protein